MSLLRKKTATLIGLFLVFYGLIVVVSDSYFVVNSFRILGVLICILSIVDLFFKKSTKNISFLGWFFVGMIMFRYTYFNLKLLVLMFGLWCLIDSLTKYITFIQFRKNKIKGAWFLLFNSIVYDLIGALCIVQPIWFYSRLKTALAIYIINYGITLTRNGLDDLRESKAYLSIKRRASASMPVLLTSIIPKVVLNAIEKKLETGEELNETVKDEQIDLEILVHLAPSSHNMFGHVDLCIGDTIISYGNYDFRSYRFFDSVGDGVIIVAPKKEYFPFSQSYLNKTIVGFGLKLTDEQRDRVDARLMEIFTDVEPWGPRAKRDPIHADEYNEYSSMLYKGTHCSFYKPKSGRFKSFFILTTNCCKFADSILGQVGTDIINLDGIITPGAYYDYFNSEYHKENSLVVSKKVYYRPEQKRISWLKRKGIYKANN